MLLAPRVQPVIVLLDVNTDKNFLSNAERIEPLFYGQAGLQIKVMPRLSAFRKKRVDFYTKGTRVFSLNDDSTDFLRNIVFDEADARGITTQEAALQSLIGRGDESVADAAARTAARIKAEEAKRVNKFSVYAINKRIDNFSRKFNLIPDSSNVLPFKFNVPIIKFTVGPQILLLAEKITLS